jgi:hypothetical protein
MGHASITTTLDLYGHLHPGDMDRYAAQLGSAAELADPVKIRPSDGNGAARGERQGDDLGEQWRARRDSNPNLLIRSKIMVVQCCPLSTERAGSSAPGRRSDPAPSGLIQVRC